MDKKPSRKKNSLVTGMIVGGAVGSVLSLLFSSKKNRATAKKYSQKLYKGGKSLGDRFLEKYKKKNKNDK